MTKRRKRELIKEVFNGDEKLTGVEFCSRICKKIGEASSRKECRMWTSFLKIWLKKEERREKRGYTQNFTQNS